MKSYKLKKKSVFDFIEKLNKFVSQIVLRLSKKKKKIIYIYKCYKFQVLFVIDY